jgi:hypothetical protein
MMHDNDKAWESPPSDRRHRERNLTEADIDALVKKINEVKHLDCRFDRIASTDLEEAVEFYKNFNKLMTESGNTIWKTVLVLGVGGVASLILLGVYSKIRQNI